MKFFSIIVLVTLAQVASFFTSLQRVSPRSVVSQKYLFGNPDPAKGGKPKKDDVGGMFGGRRATVTTMEIGKTMTRHRNIFYRYGKPYGFNEEGAGNRKTSRSNQQGTHGDSRRWQW